MSELGVFEAIHTARALRRLKPDPVPEAVITQVLDAAICAPSAGNAQNWIFLVIRDPEQRRKLGAIYRKASDIASAVYAARGRPAHMTEAQYQRLMSSGAYRWEHMADAPVLLVPCQPQPRLPPPREPAATRSWRPAWTFRRSPSRSSRFRAIRSRSFMAAKTRSTAPTPPAA